MFSLYTLAFVKYDTNPNISANCPGVSDEKTTRGRVPVTRSPYAM